MRKLMHIMLLALALLLPLGTAAQAKGTRVKPKIGQTSRSFGKSGKSGGGKSGKGGRSSRGASASSTINTIQARIQQLVDNMIYVEGGTFWMGATAEQGSDAFESEEPAHQVTVSSFSISKYEVTQAQWVAVMDTNPSRFMGGNLPVERVSWHDCQEFIRRLNDMTGLQFRLPTEAEWEYAARGAGRSCGYKYAGSDNIDDVAWYTGNSGSESHPVGTKSPNELGLYDMSGNVLEWCSDWYDKDYYKKLPSSNPRGASSGSFRVLRGGSWSSIFASLCRVSNRSGNTPDYRDINLGLRLCLSE